jgi:branched-chain amino acid aminotransferase
MSEAPELASVDGAITATTDARLPLPDDGLYRGDGVFEVIRLYGGRPFALEDHLDRLDRSAAMIELPVDRAAVERELGVLLERFGDAEGQLRIVLTRGGRRLLMTERLPEMADTIRLTTVTYSTTVILNGVKSLSYAANMQATRLAHARGGDEALLVRPDGIVLEAPTSTIFWVSESGSLRTPALELAVLDSITRRQLVRTLEVEEGSFDLDDLRSAREAFLASTTREVQAVGALDGEQLPAPGPVTEEARTAFAATLERALTARSAAD